MNSTKTVEPLLVDLSTLASMLDVSSKTVRRLLATNQLPTPLRLGRSLRWSVDILKKWIADGCPELKKEESNSG
jgi:predicted DNA-binding transcriptional regulator AlpA